MIYRQKIGIGLSSRSSPLLSTCRPHQHGRVGSLSFSYSYRYESPNLIPSNVPEVIRKSVDISIRALNSRIFSSKAETSAKGSCMRQPGKNSQSELA